MRKMLKNKITSLIIVSMFVLVSSFALTYATAPPPYQTPGFVDFDVSWISPNKTISATKLKSALQYLKDNGGGGSINSLTDGNANENSVFLGSGAGVANDNSEYPDGNVGVGINALHSNTKGMGNTAVGYKALYANTSIMDNPDPEDPYPEDPFYFSGDHNTAVGAHALRENTTGIQNDAVGAYALFQNTTGYSNTALGVTALGRNITGYNNVAIGNSALYYNSSGHDNTALGEYAGNLVSPGSTSGSTNTTSNKSVYIGESTRAKSNGDTNEIVIGYKAFGNGSNTVTLGNDDITRTYLKGKTQIYSGLGNSYTDNALKIETQYGEANFGSLNSGWFHMDTDRDNFYFNKPAYANGGFHTYSDIRLKKDIKEITNSLDKLSKIRGVYYNYKDKGLSLETQNMPKGRQVGVIAQEVEKVLPEVVTTDNNGIKSVEYSKLTSLLIEAVKEQQEQIESQNNKISDLEDRLKEQARDIEELKNLIQNN